MCDPLCGSITDHHFHHWVLLSLVGTAASTPASKDGHVPLVSHTTARPRQADTSFDSQTNDRQACERATLPEPHDATRTLATPTNDTSRHGRVRSSRQTRESVRRPGVNDRAIPSSVSGPAWRHCSDRAHRCFSGRRMAVFSCVWCVRCRGLALRRYRRSGSGVSRFYRLRLVVSDLATRLSAHTQRGDRRGRRSPDRAGMGSGIAVTVLAERSARRGSRWSPSALCRRAHATR